ncbi:MAG: tRNA uridine-5-carboxymethylaminomethyl(34) synthesis GTPase MnmE [Prevotella sp.]|uniref:tRNA uridine-5-carboxymethylaminomethyl(34) synthesis GTPase MnmE n=1 Tax=Prevotella sp. TaxID=59823 RepID=UPI002A26D884|nr:tRNA uridine-5-carboxymethylaminomethyl(34) synthesis GTPase MnmE [Prevotella sp.]MDD7318907.1 tRNA uridine-5-carboxymethylaminomethyl(34) synthesis GTPase MnmE [Prevotellaceae bacterium]MDY4019286.1 tRNA uridine-5-carboxymethylaminomethyl(34) synthesis GTPase MnmE [Prevotella sp.]
MITTDNDTICAAATAQGGALSIIRISGNEAISIASAACKGISINTPANTVHHTNIYDGNGKIIDDVMVSIFHGPHSYTGEDSIEISCHGSAYITTKIMESLVQRGCRQAMPGEYTQRAFLNGKLSLEQAEAVADLIASANAATHKMALSQLRGKVSSELVTLREQLLKITSLLELELDFSDHEDIEFADRHELLSLANTIDKRICKLAHSFETGNALKHGIPVAIIGKTNVGKSTLLNRLLKDERAIVSDIHGTTRDTIEDTMDINGVQFRFIDTAGIRHTTDQVEQIGIDRTYQTIDKARIILWVIDELPSKEEVGEIVKLTQDKTLLIVQNKIDKCPDNIIEINDINNKYTQIQVSAKNGIGIDALEECIFHSANIPIFTENDVIITSVRHYNALSRAHERLSYVIEALENNISGDLISEDLRLVIYHLSEITGKGIVTPNEVLENIFKNFCIGK